MVEAFWKTTVTVDPALASRLAWSNFSVSPSVEIASAPAGTSTGGGASTAGGAPEPTTKFSSSAAPEIQTAVGLPSRPPILKVIFRSAKRVLLLLRWTILIT